MREPTRSSCAEGHGGDPKKVDLDQHVPPESQEFGTRTHALCTETGRPQRSLVVTVRDRRPREGKEPQSVDQNSEESDADIVPKKSVKTRVTPVEPMEGRPAAKGKSVLRNAPRAQDRVGAPTQVERIGERAKEKPSLRRAKPLT
jgi:hypothetical protein